jgi:hypothetical protein
MKLNSKSDFVLNWLQYYINDLLRLAILEELEKRLLTRYPEISEKVCLTIVMEFPTTQHQLNTQ